eukprot:CAMPEP_0172159888 /NCGR_PEP_ID=MMETSP1050-20130122/5241_1 /TAXON_ID=233186 /ORGANISM="Cryptomonas curvata, Strain CCAP979/52" /LENGTH=152 /DNA_ID=CAMNT_0012829567 /DNA_START=112 /DNA_END=567 /DNA_ORIENTATION=-
MRHTASIQPLQQPNSVQGRTRIAFCVFSAVALIVAATQFSNDNQNFTSTLYQPVSPYSGFYVTNNGYYPPETLYTQAPLQQALELGGPATFGQLVVPSVPEPVRVSGLLTPVDAAAPYASPYEGIPSSPGYAGVPPPSSLAPVPPVMGQLVA